MPYRAIDVAGFAGRWWFVPRWLLSTIHSFRGPPTSILLRRSKLCAKKGHTQTYYHYMYVCAIIETTWSEPLRAGWTGWSFSPFVRSLTTSGKVTVYSHIKIVFVVQHRSHRQLLLARRPDTVLVQEWWWQVCWAIFFLFLGMDERMSHNGNKRRENGPITSRDFATLDYHWL